MNLFQKHIVTILLIFVLSSIFVGQSFAEEGGTASIISPTHGTTVSGVVTIRGTAKHSALDKYEVFLKDGDNLLWVTTAFSVVENGNLARLDTRKFPKGMYQLVIRLVKADGNYQNFDGPIITIGDQSATDTHAAQVESAFLYSTPGKAIARLRNCTGQALTFDYNSFQDFRSSGELALDGKQSDDMCEYIDFALVPGKYHGTAKGLAEDDGFTYEFEAIDGSIYNITYNGSGAGLFELAIEPISGDTPSMHLPTQFYDDSVSSQLMPVTGNNTNVVMHHQPAYIALLVLVILVVGGMLSIIKQHPKKQ
ncbi:MAG: hypothetical protein B6242_02565 [Anaerolineaceae bacterium 4572_78]|nr:MAG: hypothetical protein B6242_02565 [Anaerolineaceae bacterium 4572_78]